MLCKICNQPVDTIVRYDEAPFIDGNYYDIVCHLCHSVPRSWAYGADGSIIWYGFLDPNRLASVELLMREGWSREQAIVSIKAIKKSIKNKEYSVNVRKSSILGSIYNMPVQIWE